jgi:hypothetical protein
MTVESLDVLGLFEAVHELIEKRFGRVAAWLVTGTLLIAFFILVLVVISRVL